MLRTWLVRTGQSLKHFLLDPMPAVPVEEWVLDRLPEDYRLAVWLYLCEGMTYGEVAETLDVSEAGARGRFREGLKLFQDQLAKLDIAMPAPAVVLALGGAHNSAASKRLLKNVVEAVKMS